MTTSHTDPLPHYYGPHHGSFVSYILGYGVCLVFTVAAFAVVQGSLLGYVSFSREGLVGVILILAVAQFFVQLISFLHLGRESSPRWNLIVFGYAAVLLVLFVGGSLWIMDNLNYNMMMSPTEMDSYMIDQ